MTIERFRTFDKIVRIFGGKRVDDVGVSSKGDVTKVKRTKKLFLKNSSSISKVLKYEHMSLVERESTNTIVVESDEG